MEILINSYQAKRILSENFGNDINSKIQELYLQVKEVIEKTGHQIGENLTFLVTWGASIAGMMGPLNTYIQTKHPEISEMDLSLLLTGIIANYYFDNKKLVSKIMKKIKENGLYDIFTKIMDKAEELKIVFLEFIQSLNVTAHKMSNILSYAFIIPLIPLIYNGVSKGFITENEIDEITERIVSFGLITLSSLAIRQLVSKLINRFSSK